MTPSRAASPSRTRCLIRRGFREDGSETKLPLQYPIRFSAGMQQEIFL